VDGTIDWETLHHNDTIAAKLDNISITVVLFITYFDNTNINGAEYETAIVLNRPPQALNFGFTA